MSHDFAKKHGGEGSACDGTGIMSYNSDKPMRWSTCSVNDFIGYYNRKKWGTTCLKSELFQLNISFYCQISIKIDFLLFDLILDWRKYVAPCTDKCPDCGTQPRNLCDNPDLYGGCKGQYKSIFDSSCAKTCGVC